MKPTTAILAALIFSSVEFAQAGVDVKDRSSYSLKLDTADVSDPAEAIQKAKQGGSTVSVDVRFPASGKAPFPAVVIQHSAGGVGAREDFWARALIEAGYAVAIVDTFTGFSDRVARLGENSQTDHTVDAYATLRALQEDPRIDKARIAHLGMSRGAMSMVIGADRRIESALAPQVGFAAHVLLYPNCYPGWRNPHPTGASILFLLGEKDDLAFASVCKEYASRLAAAGGDVQVVTYPGAAHAFDDDTGVSRNDRSPSGAGCELVIEDDGHITLTESGASTAGKSWRDFQAKDLLAAQCIKRGYSAGGSKESREKAATDAIAFLKRVL